LTIPRNLAARLFMGADIHGAVLTNSGTGRLIAHHLRVFADVAHGLTEAEGEAAVRAALVLVERALGTEIPAGAPEVEALRRTVRETAIYFIDRNLISPTLGVGAIAGACAVSRS